MQQDPGQDRPAPGGTEPEPERHCKLEQESAVRHQVDQQGILREPLQVEHPELTVEENVVNRRAVQPERALALDHARLEVDEADLHLQEAHAPGNDQRLGDRAALPGGADCVERIGSPARAKHHVEADEEGNRVRAAIGHDVAMIESEHTQIEQHAHHSGSPAESQANCRRSGRGPDGIGRSRAVGTLENREAKRTGRFVLPWLAAIPSRCKRSRIPEASTPNTSAGAGRRRCERHRAGAPRPGRRTIDSTT